MNQKATTSSAMVVQIWLHDLRVGGSELSLLNELQNIDREKIQPTVVVMGSDMTLADRFESSNIPVVQLRQGSLWSRARETWSLLREPDVRVVNTMLFWPNVTVRPLARLMRIPVLTTLVNSDYGTSQRESSRHGAWAVVMAQYVDAVTSLFATRFRAVSDDVATVMGRRLHVRNAKITTLHRGRNLSTLGRRTPERRASAREQFQVDDRTVFVCIGRQDRQKAQELAVSAFARLAADYPNVTLLLVGRPGESSAKILEAIQASAVQPLDVRQIGELSDIGDVVSAADYLLFPSRWEGLPGTVIEAMALETPLLLSDIPGSREVTGGHAWFYPPDDEQACYKTMVRCFTEAYPAEYLSTGRARCEEMFDVTVIAQRLSDLWIEIARKG